MWYAQHTHTGVGLEPRAVLVPATWWCYTPALLLLTSLDLKTQPAAGLLFHLNLCCRTHNEVLVTGSNTQTEVAKVFTLCTSEEVHALW